MRMLPKQLSVLQASEEETRKVNVGCVLFDHIATAVCSTAGNASYSLHKGLFSHIHAAGRAPNI